MVLFGITLVTLVEYLQAAGPGLLTSFYAGKAAFDKYAPGQGDGLGVFP